MEMDFCFYCGRKPYKQDDTGKWICHECEKLRRPEEIVAPFPSDKSMLVDGIQALTGTTGSRWIEENKELMGKSKEELEAIYDNLEKGGAGKAPIRIASLEPDKVSPKTLKTLRETSDLESKLGHFIGTTKYYPHWSKSIRWTDGINFLCEEAGAYWLIDIVASYQSKLKAPFQLWKIKVNPDNTALVTMQEDTGQPYLAKQEIPYTDFPLREFEFYCIDRVCMVKSEY